VDELHQITYLLNLLKNPETNKLVSEGMSILKQLLKEHGPEFTDIMSSSIAEAAIGLKNKLILLGAKEDFAEAVVIAVAGRK
jgi:hypothetical protein